jgi:hypothetical protein
MSKSRGQCEVCKKQAPGNSRHHALLPSPRHELERPEDEGGDRWEAARGTYHDIRGIELAEKFGQDSVETVMQMTALFAQIIEIGSDNIVLIKAGVTRMAVVVNEMLPTLNGRQGKTRVYDYRDLDGALDPMPERVQNVFVELVGNVLLHSKGGPHDSAVNINEAVDRLAALVRGRAE